MDQQNGPKRLGNYDVLKLLGKGGFADVYLGEHRHLGTQAAIKVLRLRLDQGVAEQFLIEARTIAKLDHPHIVRILDFDVQEGVPFLVMEYAPGGTLRHHYPRGSLVPLSVIVSSVKQVAGALQYAHEHKLIHRDVKPENLLVGRRGEALLSDFGIALPASNSSGPPTGKALAGTVAYMAPEQILGKPRPQSDQYALGIIAYEWLTGKRPFEGTSAEIMSQQLHMEAPPLREQRPDLPAAVEEAVLTALAKDYRQRFASVWDFALALERVANSGVPSFRPLAPAVSHVPATTAPPTHVTVVRNEAPRQTGPVSLRPTHTRRRLSRRQVVTGFLAFLGVGSVVGAAAWIVQEHGLSAGETRRNPAVSPAPSPVRSPTGPGGTSRPTSSPGTKRSPRSSPSPVPPASTLLIYRGHTNIVNAVTWSPDGERIASASSDGTVQVWDATTGNRFLLYRGHALAVNTVAWSPGGKWLASAGQDTTVQVWDAESGALLLAYHGHAAPVYALAWSPDGAFIASAGSDTDVRVWKSMTGTTVLTYQGHSSPVWGVAWSPNGRFVASGGDDATAQVWNARTGGRLLTYREHGATVNSLAWSPGGRQIVSGSTDETAQVWDAMLGQKVLTYAGQTGAIYAVGFSPDRTRIASAGGDTSAQVWSARSAEAFFIYRGHTAPVLSLVWSPPFSGRIATSSSDKTVQVWTPFPAS